MVQVKACIIGIILDRLVYRNIHDIKELDYRGTDDNIKPIIAFPKKHKCSK